MITQPDTGGFCDRFEPLDVAGQNGHVEVMEWLAAALSRLPTHTESVMTRWFTNRCETTWVAAYLLNQSV